MVKLPMSINSKDLFCTLCVKGNRRRKWRERERERMKHTKIWTRRQRQRKREDNERV